MSKTLQLISLGCSKNLVDSEVMLGKLKEYTLTDDTQNADVLIVNTCGFIGSAKEESLETIFELHENRKKDSVLVVAGCLTQRYKEELALELPEVDLFSGVGDYDKIDEILKEKKSRFSDKVFLANDEVQRVITGSSYHAYVKLSEGCNQSCSFCAIPSFKGKLNSRDLSSIKRELENLIQQGIWDFTFISQDSSSYLRDKKEKEGLIQLIDMVEEIEGVKSAKILYLYPSTTSLELIQKIADSTTFESYYDMPLQHISNSLLKKMKRGKGSTKIRELVDAMRAVPNSFVRTTFIAGHPGESEADFEELCAFVTEFEFNTANVFSYSDEEGTSAYKSDEKLEQKIIDTRADKIGDLIHQAMVKRLRLEVGKIVDVVVDGVSEEHEFFLSARKLLWAPDVDGEILINDNELGDDLEFGVAYKALITELAGDQLVATILK